MTIFDVDIGALKGGSAQLDRPRGHSVLVANVAPRCGSTPQFAGLQSLQDPDLIAMAEKSLPH